MSGYGKEERREPARPRAEKEPAANRLFLAIVILYILTTALLAFLAGRGVSLRLPVAVSLISGELVLLIPTAAYVACRRPKLWTVSERWRLPLAAVPLLILTAYCILPLISLVNLVSMWLSQENAAASLLVPMQRLPLWASLLCVSALPGILEEFIFRGLLYGAYRTRRVWGAIFTSALLFGLMHMNLNQFCYAFVMGVVFCLLYEGTGSVLAPMLIHAVYNGNSVLMTYLLSGSPSLEEAEGALLLEEALGGGPQMAATVITLTIIALLGLAAAGGLYVAVVRLCRRGPQVKLLFQRDSFNKRKALAAGAPAGTGNADLNGERRETISRRLWGPVLWLGVILASGVIVWDFLVL